MRTALIAFAVLLPLGSGAALAAGNQGDWPCIQREVPQISLGMVWSGGAIDADDASWTSDAQVAPKVLEVTSRRKSVEEAVAAVDAFAADLKQDRPRLLTALFVGSFQRLNAERRQIMSGIKRYAKRQAGLAEQIKQRSMQRADLADKPSPTEAEKAQLAELQEQLTWDTRIYEEREQSLRYVCETPVMLEQRLFQIGRHISQLVSQN
ncbi:MULTISPECIES: hypothetical protein [Rhodomicrobium]|uniref:hypothetical protein n=1 Tax=Rhodomicrobium TaxID=1068 RepID=UPI000F747E23|nr:MULTISPECIES: hypothetical protein [Rhodomicrobium]